LNDLTETTIIMETKFIQKNTLNKTNKKRREQWQ
jgi:hypothetical protein